MKIRLRTCITLLIKRIHVAFSVNFMFYNINLNSYITQSALIEFPAHASRLVIVKTIISLFVEVTNTNFFCYMQRNLTDDVTFFHNYERTLCFS